MAAFRAVRPRKPWLAGSSWSYASSSTIGPPTPSTRSVTPIRSGATSCTERAKKSRGSRCTCAGVVAHQRGEREREQAAAQHADDPAGDDREAEARQRREHARLEVAERGRA